MEDGLQVFMSSSSRHHRRVIVLVVVAVHSSSSCHHRPLSVKRFLGLTDYLGFTFTSSFLAPSCFVYFHTLLCCIVSTRSADLHTLLICGFCAVCGFACDSLARVAQLCGARLLRGSIRDQRKIVFFKPQLVVGRQIRFRTDSSEESRWDLSFSFHSFWSRFLPTPLGSYLNITPFSRRSRKLIALAQDSLARIGEPMELQL